MKWMMRFKFAKPKPGEEDGIVAILVDCEEADLQGEKEARIMELEKNTGRTWICVGIVKMVRKEGEGL